MNIIIAEQLNRANKLSIELLNSTREQSIKRRNQVETYNYTLDEEDSGWINHIIRKIKTYWYC